MAAVRPNDDLVARVVAWHNRNPLARRIVPAQVVSIGYVSFPFVVPPGEARPQGSAVPTPEGASGCVPAGTAATAAQEGGEGGGRLRERARARAANAPPQTPAAGAPPARAAALGKRKAWRAAFAEDLLAPSTPRQVARWVLRHGSPARPTAADVPVRDVDAATGTEASAVLTRLWVITAAIEAGAQRVRVLVSPLDAREVLGPRIDIGGRAGVLAGGAMVACAVAGAAIWIGGPRLLAAPAAARAASTAAQPPRMTVAPPALAAPAASATAIAAATPAAAAIPAAAAAPAAAATAAAASAPASAPTSAPAPAPAPAPAAPPAARAPAAPSPPSVVPASAPGTGPTRRLIVPPLGEAVRLAAREASEAARAELAERRASQARTHPAGSAAAPVAAATSSITPPAPPPATAWAVSTRNLRTRFESEQMLAALRDVAYRSGHGSELKLEVLPAGDDWRAVGWPLATRTDAERLRAALAERGLKAEVVQF